MAIIKVVACCQDKQLRLESQSQSDPGLITCECPLRDNDGGGGYGMRFYCGYVIWFGTLYRDAVLITNIDTPP
jgi:hypothetical protein